MHLSSLSLAAGPADLAALVALLECSSRQPALPAPQQAQQAPAPPPAAPQAAGAAPQAEGPPGATRLSVSVGQACVSLSTLAELRGSQAQQQQGKGQGQRGLAGWASSLHFSRGPCPLEAGGGEGPGSMQLAVGCLGVVLTQQQPGCHLPATSPVLRWAPASTEKMYTELECCPCGVLQSMPPSTCRWRGQPVRGAAPRQAHPDLPCPALPLTSHAAPAALPLLLQLALCAPGP